MPQMSPMLWLMFPVIIVILNVVSMVIYDNGNVSVELENKELVNEFSVEW